MRDSPPPQTLPPATNFRDIGGAVGRYGEVRRRVVFRSGELNRLSDSGVDVLVELGIGTVIDLRSSAEVAARGEDRLPPSTIVHRLPITEADGILNVVSERFARGEYGRPDMDIMLSTYRALATHWRQRFVETLSIVAQTNGAVVVHCTHGKDRAGFAAALILDALGVDRDTIEADYLASNEARRPENEKILQEIRAAALERTGRTEEQLGLTWIRDLFYVDRRFLRAAFAEVERHHGGTVGFLGAGRSGAVLRDRLVQRLVMR